MGIGLAALAILLAVVLMGTRGTHLELKGKVLKARTGALDENSSVAVLDFRVANPSDIRFVVRDVKVTLEKASGEKVEGDIPSRTDLTTLFAYNKFLGEKYNEGLGIKDVVPAHGQIDRMVAARFGVPQQELEKGKSLTLWVQDMDGAEFETVYAMK